MHKLGELGPQCKSDVDGPIPVGVIISKAPSIGGVEHKVSSRSTCLVDGDVQKLGGGGAQKISPKCDKHVPYIISTEVNTPNGDGLGANIAKVGGLVKATLGATKQELGFGIDGMDGTLKEGKWIDEGGGEGQLLLTLDCIVFEVACHEGCLYAQPVTCGILVVVLATLGWVPTRGTWGA